MSGPAPGTEFSPTGDEFCDKMLYEAFAPGGSGGVPTDAEMEEFYAEHPHLERPKAFAARCSNEIAGRTLVG